MAKHGYDEKNEWIEDAVNQLYAKLEKKKSEREASFRLFDLGITKQCTSTQLPAFCKNERGQYVSREIFTKLNTAKDKELFSELLPDIKKKKYRFANKFEELGGTLGTKNYLAVVVIDGNKMGQKIEHFREEFRKNSCKEMKTANEAYKNVFLNMSLEIDKLYKTAVRDMITTLAEKLDILLEKGKITGKTDKNGTIVLPIRPLIQAGDDICFVTDARISIALTKEVLNNVENAESEPIKGEKMHAGAGVAIVKVSYPFFRAHALAEQLCHSAKAMLEEDEDASVLDFHVVQGEIEGTLAEIRREKYQCGKLTSKPFYLHEKEGRSSQVVFDDHMQLMKDIIKMDIIGRGALKEYRNALSGGETKAKQYISDRRIGARVEKELERTMPDSYVNGHCIDFDVLEMLDIYSTLEGK